MTPPFPKIVYAACAGMIDPVLAQRVFNSFAFFSSPDKGVEAIHLLLQSTGGDVGTGVALYNYFRTYPIPVTLYNSGTVASIAVIAFLGARHRKASPFSTFMIHKTASAPPPNSSAPRLEQYAFGLRMDDDRTEQILRSAISLPEAKWQICESADLYLTAQEALQAGLIDEIAEFSPAAGVQLFGV